MRSIHEHVRAIEHHASAIADAVAEPDAALFTVNADVIPALERAFNLKSGIDAALAYAADRARAGDRVGSSRTVDYLMKELDLSYPEAMNRLRLGHQNHGEIIDPSPAPPPEPEPEDEGRSEEGQRRAAEERRRLEEERRRRAEEHQRRQEAQREKAREQARKSRLSQEKLRVIERELDNLNGDAKHSHNDLYVRAVTEAGKRTPEDLRDWVRTQVVKANRASTDPHAAFKRRRLTIGRQDSDGGAEFHGYAPANTLALLEAALSPARTSGHLVDDPDHKDTRTMAQRRLDGLSVILHNHSAERLKSTGVATVVVSISAKDIEDMTNPEADHRYPTNTRAMMTPADILRLGATKYNYVVVHHPKSGDPLHIGRTERLATVEQRLALLASHLVCTNPDCTEPFCNCEIHHIEPYGQGGETDIFNLAAVCIRHHSDNRDQRDGQGARGHVARDPDSGRVGYQPPPRPGNPHPAVEVNNTERQEHSGGAKIRKQQWPGEGPETPDGDSTTTTRGEEETVEKPQDGPPRYPNRGRPGPEAGTAAADQGTRASGESPPVPPRAGATRHESSPPPHTAPPPARPGGQHSFDETPPAQPPLFPFDGAG